MANGCGKRKKDGRRYVRTKLTRTSPLKSARVMSLSKSLSAASSTTAFLDKSASARVIELPKSSNTMAGWERKGKERKGRPQGLVGWLGRGIPTGGRGERKKEGGDRDTRRYALCITRWRQIEPIEGAEAGLDHPTPLFRVRRTVLLSALFFLSSSLSGDPHATRNAICAAHIHTHIYICGYK